MLQGGGRIGLAKVLLDPKPSFQWWTRFGPLWYATLELMHPPRPPTSECGEDTLPYLLLWPAWVAGQVALLLCSAPLVRIAPKFGLDSTLFFWPTLAAMHTDFAPLVPLSEVIVSSLMPCVELNDYFFFENCCKNIVLNIHKVYKKLMHFVYYASLLANISVFDLSI